MKKVRAKRIAFIAGALAIGGFAVVVAPLIDPALRELEARRIEAEQAKYAGGLSPCAHYPQALESLIVRRVGRTPDAIAILSPTFSQHRVIALEGDKLHYVMFDEVRRGDVEPSIALIRTSALRPEISKRTIGMIQKDIVFAHADRPLGLDGASYYFRIGNGCAMTWSPHPNTHPRAYALTELFHALERRASAGASANAEDDAAVLAALAALGEH